MIAQIIAVWTELVAFFVELFPSLLSLFWTAGTDGGAGQLTFVGVLAVVMAGIAIALTVLAVIRSFFRMRG